MSPRHETGYRKGYLWCFCGIVQRVGWIKSVLRGNIWHKYGYKVACAHKVLEYFYWQINCTLLGTARTFFIILYHSIGTGRVSKCTGGTLVVRQHVSDVVISFYPANPISETGLGTSFRCAESARGRSYSRRPLYSMRCSRMSRLLHPITLRSTVSTALTVRFTDRLVR